jgi:branched-chain amino acid transport system substrate-binding protein
MQRRSTSRARVRLRAIGLVLSVLGVTSCGADDEAGGDTTSAGAAITPAATQPDASSAPTTSTASGTNPRDTTTRDSATSDTATGGTGAPGPATGEPLRIGFVNQEKGALAFPDIGDGARAARDYINDELGGLDGRPIEFVECATEMSPESSASCANQMVEADVPLVLNGIDLANSSLHPILQSAGIPLVGQEPFTAEDYQDGFFFGGSSAAYILGSSVFIRDVLKAETVSYLVYPGPAPEGAFKAFAEPAFQKAGIEYMSTSLDPTLPDFTPVVAAAIANNPDVLIGFFQEPDCTKVVQTAKQLGFQGDIIAGACGQFVRDAGDDAEGVYALGDLYSVDDPDAAPAEAQEQLDVYMTALEKYAPTRTPGVFTQITFASMMNVYSILQEIGADDVTAERVVEALQATKEHPDS